MGGTGIVFGLDAPQASLLTSLGLNTQLGVSASFGNAQGGQDAIQVVRLTPTFAAVPEPSTCAMMMPAEPPRRRGDDIVAMQADERAINNCPRAIPARPEQQR